MEKIRVWFQFESKIFYKDIDCKVNQDLWDAVDYYDAMNATNYYEFFYPFFDIQYTEEAEKSPYYGLSYPADDNQFRAFVEGD